MLLHCICQQRVTVFVRLDAARICHVSVTLVVLCDVYNRVPRKMSRRQPGPVSFREHIPPHLVAESQSIIQEHSLSEF